MTRTGDAYDDILIYPARPEDDYDDMLIYSARPEDDYDYMLINMESPEDDYNDMLIYLARLEDDSDDNIELSQPGTMGFIKGSVRLVNGLILRFKMNVVETLMYTSTTSYCNSVALEVLD
ncbi:hypothetical protein FXO37_36162 [Capsicum annuum]|nr:hypothetical protein FXO37_36162 [Capsicum annuum]